MKTATVPVRSKVAPKLSRMNRVSVALTKLSPSDATISSNTGNLSANHPVELTPMGRLAIESSAESSSFHWIQREVTYPHVVVYFGGIGQCSSRVKNLASKKGDAMTKEQWMIEAKFLFHANLPNATSEWVDEVVEALCSEFGDLEPDEAMAMYVVAQTGPRGTGALVH